MFDLDTALRAIAGAALALFLTPAIRPLGLSPRAARLCQQASLVLIGVAMAGALAATVLWFIDGH
ncbi:hypothetical protein [Methylocystis parvus]|uniref:Uncharacterized protein n=1 Tax=Methylocystis parvus TaxID=134 RepID=A0A6B8MBV1_9HYPH|nr:hypothetical protein [Methylocystis parvus]QGM98120.1 hypothetical protein F7D14_11955 [Methylocystis parvus]WBK01558.1 hypothetical protein MMG94_07620 [Methylocystis parvus OBBP]